jgi:stearoyl-CoA desaturase (delta-9 desaturase)
MWGSVLQHARRFAQPGGSRSSGFGEGWHNNHHAHPTSARHGLAWYEFDPSWLLIKVLKAFGVAKSIKVASVHSQLLSDREAA